MMATLSIIPSPGASPAQESRLQAVESGQARAGMWGTPAGHPPNSQLAVGDKIMYVTRFVPQKQRVILSGAVLANVTAGQDDVADVGIYSAAGARLASSGALSGKLNSVGRHVLALTAGVTLLAGTAYYSAFIGAKGAGAAASLAASSLSAALIYDAWKTGADGTSVDLASPEFYYAILGSVLLPANLPALTTNSASVVVAWREY